MSSALSGRVDSIEDQIGYLNQMILQRPDIATFSTYQVGHEQEIESVRSTSDILKIGLRSINSLYANLFNTVSTNNTAYTGHTGDSSLHSVRHSSRTISGDYTLAATDRVILFNNTGQTISATLPSVSLGSGYYYRFKKIDSGSFTGIVTGSATIDGAGSYLLTTQYSSATIYSNGIVWYTF